MKALSPFVEIVGDHLITLSLFRHTEREATLRWEMIRWDFALLFLSAWWFSLKAYAYPLPNPFNTLSIPATFSTRYDFEGIVKLSNCSGALIQMEGQPSTSPAWILTNGHCNEFGFPPPHRAITYRRSSRRFQLMNSVGRVVGVLQGTELTYATMTGTDLALYRVRESYNTILHAYGVRPLLLSSKRPVEGFPIEVISGYWGRGFTCAIEAFVHELREDDYSTFDSIRYSRPGCETFGGTSGSPIIKKGERLVVGVNNTGNESGRRCTTNNPCEINENGDIYYQKGLSYGQQTYWVYSCLDENFELDLKRPGCRL